MGAQAFSPNEHPRFGILRRAGGWASTTWSLIGICLAAVLLVELALRLLTFVKDNWIDPP
jgi:hypothetical protein